MIRRPVVLPESMLQIHSPNRNRIASRISTAPGAAADLPSAVRFVFVCFTNRCGSALLGDILVSTGFFAQPFESLNAGDALSCCQENNLRSFRQYFEHIVRRDTRNDFYMVKVAPEQIVLLSETGILDQVAERSDFLLVNRTDKLAQAISRTIAEQNNRWAWDSPSDFPDESLVYSPQRIAQHIQDVMLQNRSFEQFFALNGLVPITVEYERLVKAPQLELDEVASRLGLRGLTMDTSRLRYRRQTSQINRDWRVRYLQQDAPSPASLIGNTALRRGARPAVPCSVAAEIVAHVHNVGDVTGACGAWVRTPGNGLWIEGFSITPRQGMAPSGIEYAGIEGADQEPRWVSGGTFCGTRGKSAPLGGFGLRLHASAVDQYFCAYSARFVDGTEMGPVAAGEICRAGSLAPLETFQILLGQIQGRS